MNGSTAYLLGRAFARVLAELRDKPVADLRIGVGRDMRLQAPEMAGRLSDGLVAEGAHVLDAGMVGTEMLYFMVGARELDGGAMVTASHNPKAYTGVKLVREGALALSGETGITAIRDLILAGLGDAPGGGSTEDVDIAGEFRERALSFIDVDDLKPLKVVVDGGNGMAGEMVGPAARRASDRADLHLLGAGRQLPRPRAESAAAREPRVHHRAGPLGGRRRRHRLGRRCRSLLLHRRPRASSSTATSSPPCSPSWCSRRSPGADILYDVRASRAVPDTVAAAGGTAHINRVGHAFMKRAMKEIGGEFAGEVSGHYYFRAVLQRRFGNDPGAAGARADLEVRPQALRPGRRPARQVLHLGRDQLRGRRPGGEDERDRRAPPDAEISWLDGVSVDYPDWHFNVRPSNTEPLLRLNLESLVSREDMEAKRDQVLASIRS